jgi:hypothetical protein
MSKTAEFGKKTQGILGVKRGKKKLDFSCTNLKAFYVHILTLSKE